MLALLLATGCGSTVRPQGATDALNGGSLGGTSPGLAAGEASLQNGAGPSGLPADVAADGGAPVGSGSVRGGQPGGAGAVRGVSAGRLPARHRGVAPTTIKVGFLYLASAGTVVGSFGVQGYSQGDELGEFKALVADQNARGGVGGRMLQVVPRDLGGIRPTDYEAACTFFVQDQPVFMVFSALGHVELLNTCLARGSVGYTSNYVAPPDRLMRQLGSIYAPDDIAAERYATLLGRSLVDAAFFQPGAKVGIIRQDTDDYRRITERILRPILASAGVEVVAEETYDPTDSAKSTSDAGPLTFRLRAAGVTHVVSYESPLFYMTAAESQSWRPYWAVSSRAGPGTFLEGAAPMEQLKKTMGPGWQPVSDIASQRLKGYTNSEERRCLTTLANAGHKYTGPPRYVAQMLCGELYHFVHVLAVAREISTTEFRLTAEALAPYLSPMTFAMSFAGGRHDGAAAYRVVAWSASCSCYAYSSAIQPMPTV